MTMRVSQVSLKQFKSIPVHEISLQAFASQVNAIQVKLSQLWLFALNFS